MNHGTRRCDEGETTPEAAMLKRRLGMIAAAVGVIGAISGVSAWLLWPEPDDWSQEAYACVTDTYVGYWESSGKYSFKMDYQNSCDRKVSCAVSVSINNANESFRKKGILNFASRGQTPETKTYSVAVTSRVGMVNAGRNCRFA
jgi:hypothetical protein